MDQHAALRAGHGHATLYNWLEDGMVFTVRAHCIRLGHWQITHLGFFNNPSWKQVKAEWIWGGAGAAARFGENATWTPDPLRWQDRVVPR